MPAPSRQVYVKPVVGNSYAAVIGSTNLSGWEQPADRTARMARVTFDDPPPPEETAYLTASQTLQENDDPPADDYPNDLWTLATDLMGGAWESHPARAGAQVEFLHDGWRMVTAFPGDDDPVGYTHTVSGELGGDSTTPAARWEDMRWADSWRPAWPAGAIGYEVEQYEVQPGVWLAYSDVVSLDLQVILDPVTEFGTLLGMEYRVVLHEVIGSGELRFDNGIRSTGWGASMVDRTTYGEVTKTVLESGGMDVPEVHEFTIDEFVGVPARTGAFEVQWALWKPPWEPTAGPLVGDNNLVRGTLPLTLVGTYHIRPPRIRWIYPDDVEPLPVLSTPIRRTSHRHDSLAGGATRNYPPSRSIQTSNRIGGGYL